MGGTINLGKVFGIQLKLHYSWFLIFILLAVSLVAPDWSSPFAWAIGIATCLLFFISVVAHELAHSLVGRANGIPVSSITLFIFGGMAMMTREASYPKAELKMAAAGPICSAIIGGICLLILGGLGQVIPTRVAEMFWWLMFMNFALAIFNLIPGFPLDGGRLFRAAIWRRSGNFRHSTRIATRVGQGVGYLFIGGGIGVAVLSLVPLVQLPLSLNPFSGLWLAFIGWFLKSAAQTSYRQTEWREALRRFTAAQVMSTSNPVVPPDITLGRLVEEHIFPTGYQLFMVFSEDRFEGILTLDSIKAVSRRDWGITRAKDIMTPRDKLRVASPDENALSVLEGMNESGMNQILVVREGRVMGLVNRESLTGFLRVHSELGTK